MAAHPRSVDPWLTGEIRHARELLDADEAARCVTVLREAERVAIAQGYPEVLPKISALAEEASERGDAATRRKAQRIIARDIGGSRRRDRVETPQFIVRTRHVDEGPRSPRHPNWRTLAFIWAGVLVLGLVVAIVFAIVGEDDPTISPDEPAGIGALAGAVGLAVTFIYVAASVLFNPPRRHPSGWVVAAIVLGGSSLGMITRLLEVSQTVDWLISPGLLALIGVYVGVSLLRRRSA
jgi:hypothetical protein